MGDTPVCRLNRSARKGASSAKTSAERKSLLSGTTNGKLTGHLRTRVAEGVGGHQPQPHHGPLRLCAVRHPRGLLRKPRNSFMVKTTVPGKLMNVFPNTGQENTLSHGVR